jgi:hypothetical protein
VNSSTTTARTVGILFLVSYVGFAVGSALLASSLDVSTDLAAIHANRAAVIVGTLLAFLNVVAILGIAVLLFPWLRRHGEGVTLWYVGLRIIEGGTYVLGMVSTLSLLTLSEESVSAGASAAGQYQALRVAAVAQNYWAGHIATVAFIVGAIAFYSLLYRSRLVPRFISVWGLIAVALLTAANVVAPDITQGFQPAMLMYLPIAANEVFLAVWLIVKGFDGSALDRPIRPHSSPSRNRRVDLAFTHCQGT